MGGQQSYARNPYQKPATSKTRLMEIPGQDWGYFDLYLQTHRTYFELTRQTRSEIVTMLIVGSRLVSRGHTDLKDVIDFGLVYLVRITPDIPTGPIPVCVRCKMDILVRDWDMSCAVMHYSSPLYNPYDDPLDAHADVLADPWGKMHCLDCIEAGKYEWAEDIQWTAWTIQRWWNYKLHTLNNRCDEDAPACLVHSQRHIVKGWCPRSCPFRAECQISKPDM